MAWNRPSENAAESRVNVGATSSSRHRWYLAGAAVAVGAGVAAWWLWPSPGPHHASPAAHPSKAIREATPAAAPKAAAVTVATNKVVRMEMGQEVVSSRPVTNVHGGVTEYMVLADGRKISKYTPPRAVFDNASDQMIAMLLSVKPGQQLPPLPGLASIDEEFAKSLLSPIRIDDDDPEDVKEIKRQVQEVRHGLVEEIRNGGSVREVLARYNGDLAKFAESHQMAKEQMAEIRKTDGAEAAEEFLRRVNEKFRSEGIPEIEPKKVKSQKKGQEQ